MPSYEMPAFDGIGANEYIVDVTHDAVRLHLRPSIRPRPGSSPSGTTRSIAATARRISGETDFPCIYGERVGLGRSYVRLDRLSYDGWIDGLRQGRAYVSDGKSHLLDFAVNGQPVGVNGSELRLEASGRVRVTAAVAARLDGTPPDIPLATRPWHQTPYWDLERARIGRDRTVPVELVVNGLAVARETLTADGVVRPVTFDVAVDRSSWIALRILPSSHTNPMFVLVDGRPVRASKASADWCLAAVDRCWTQKAPRISERERPEAARAYEHARATYRQRRSEMP